MSIYFFFLEKTENLTDQKSLVLSGHFVWRINILRIINQIHLSVHTPINWLYTRPLGLDTEQRFKTSNHSPVDLTQRIVQVSFIKLCTFSRKTQSTNNFLMTTPGSSTIYTQLQNFTSLKELKYNIALQWLQNIRISRINGIYCTN